MRSGATCDTSVLVPALLAWHPAHDTCREVVSREVDVLVAHVLLECFSVLTRLPAPHRVGPLDAANVLAHLKMKTVNLPPTHHSQLIAALASRGLRGGAVYDALVGATAAHHELRLLTRDRRARTAYDTVGVSYTLA